MKPLLIFAFILITSALVAQTKIDAEDADKYVGERVTVSGKVASASVKNAAKNTILNVGPSSNNIVFNIVIGQSDKKNFSYVPENYLLNKNISVTGRIVDVNGTPGIMVSRPEDIRFEVEDGDVEFRPSSFEFFNKFFDDK